MIDNALKGVERVSSWPVQALNIALFALVLFICWLFIQQMRKDMAALQKNHDTERREYIDALKGLVSDTGKIVERNSVIFERIDRRLENIERQKRNDN